MVEVEEEIETSRYTVVIVGGGSAGITTANLLARAGIKNVAIIDPSSRHFYQPLWTLVGAGAASQAESVRPEASFIPRGHRWIQKAAEEIDPEQQYVITSAGERVHYDFLVVATGVEFDWQRIPGLIQALGKKEVSTNYSFDLAPKTWEIIRNFKGGAALFHMPGTPIKCPGAPQKIMYLAADYFRRNNILSKTQIIYGSGGKVIYGAREYADVLNRVLDRYGVDARFNHELVEIRPAKKEAVFEVKDGEVKDGEVKDGEVKDGELKDGELKGGEANGERAKGGEIQSGEGKNPAAANRVTIHYDLLHVVPPQRPPRCVRDSPLADPQKAGEGWVNVDKFTLQHVQYPNVFALGDCANTPNAKTGAAAVHQAWVVAHNLLALLKGREPAMRYDGYIACPIVTGYRKMLLCEADYSGRPAPMIPFINTFRERYDMWLLKRYGLPWLYWNVFLRGRTVPLLRKHTLSPGTRAGSALPDGGEVRSAAKP